MSWCADVGAMSEEQGGFKRSRGCTEQIFVLSEIIRLKVAFLIVVRTHFKHEHVKNAISINLRDSAEIFLLSLVEEEGGGGV